jgi:hypothetical protein
LRTVLQHLDLFCTARRPRFASLQRYTPPEIEEAIR